MLPLSSGSLTLPLCLIGIVYLNSLEVGWASTIVGFVVLALYIPCGSTLRKRSFGDRERKIAVSENSV